MRSNFVNGVDASDGYAYIFRSFDFTTGLTIHTVPGYDNVTAGICHRKLLQVDPSRLQDSRKESRASSPALVMFWMDSAGPRKYRATCE